MRAPEQLVGIVCVLYYKDYIGPTLRALHRIQAEIACAHTVLVLNGTDVSLEYAQTRAASMKAEIIRHDNCGAEFGGYQVGVERLTASNQPSWVIFANDTFATHGHFGNADRRRLIAQLIASREHPTIVGRVESLPRSFELAGHLSHRWITSNIFAVNHAALHALRGRIYDPALESLVTETADLGAFFDRDMSPVLRSHVANWLFGYEKDYPTWYAASPLAAHNAVKMARKARAILQELHLSASLEASGAEFVDLSNLTAREKVVSKLERIVQLPLKKRRTKDSHG